MLQRCLFIENLTPPSFERQATQVAQRRAIFTGITGPKKPGRSGALHLSWLVEFDLQQGALRDFLQLTEEMVSSALSEAGTVIFECAISSDERKVVIFERYTDAETAIRHLDARARMYGDRFSKLVTRGTFIVFGAVTEEVKECLGPLKWTFADPTRRITSDSSDSVD